MSDASVASDSGLDGAGANLERRDSHQHHELEVSNSSPMRLGIPVLLCSDDEINGRESALSHLAEDDGRESARLL